MKQLPVIAGIIITLLLTTCSHSFNELDLSGSWGFRTDPGDMGIEQAWFNRQMDTMVSLPGSMAENGKGNPVSPDTRWTGSIMDSSYFLLDRYARYRKAGNIKIPFWLQPKLHYLGAAWYQKTIEIPARWYEKHIELFLERPHWETMVWVDGYEAGMQNSLGTAHVYDLSRWLSPGQHVITIRVDNRIKAINPGPNSHSIADHTQSNWNGIAGKIKLHSKPRIFIQQVDLYPDIQGKLVRARIRIRNNTAVEEDGTLTICSATGNNHKLPVKRWDIHIAGEQIIEVTYPMGDTPLPWDEFHPNLYRMKIGLTSAAGKDEREISFGMREFKRSGNQLQINGRPLFLRGTLECAIFPKTGYPATDVATWERIFRICREHGLNHMRFHSWCPPGGAFTAADKTGFYLQVECSSWANQGASIGDGALLDSWLYKEAEQIIARYGNHPSFCMMAYGNEPAGQNQAIYLEKFIEHFRSGDNRRVYTGAAGWPCLENADYCSDPRARIQHWGEGLHSIINEEAPRTDFDYRDIISQVSQPYVSHEIGQWCAYPDFREIEKYTGVLKARNFEIFRETLAEAGLIHLADSFLLASGKLQALCYKADIEAALRTPGMAGFQLLDLHDFPGQGTALVGVLDAFWDEKGYITPEAYSHFCNQTVPLARMKKRVFTNEEEFAADIEVAHFGAVPLHIPGIRYEIRTSYDDIITEGNLESRNIGFGTAIPLGKITVPLRGIDKAQQLHLEVRIDTFSNGWDFWVYPAQQSLPGRDKVYLTASLNDSAIHILEEGGMVLWSLRKGMLNEASGGNIHIGFSTIFWNTAWTRGQAPHSMGILCNPEHPAFQAFPTEYHSNWQWWDAMHHGQAINLETLPVRVSPIVRIIDDWFENRNLGLIFETRSGNGRMIVCGTDLHTRMEERIEARQLLLSLTSYMQSEDFHPEISIPPAALARLVQ